MFRQFRKKSLFQRVSKFVLQEEEQSTAVVQQGEKMPVNVKQEVQSFVSLQEEIANLERMRMKRLDERLQTDTHFHETEHYEERLDSEHIMRRSVLVRRDQEIEKEKFFSGIYNPDPQKKIEPPKIRDMMAFRKLASEQIPYPRHHKQFKDGDFFKYLEPDHLDESKALEFSFKENMYTQLMQLLMNTRVVEFQQGTVSIRQIFLYRIRQLLNSEIAKYVYFYTEYQKFDIIPFDEVFSGKIIRDMLTEKYYDFKLDIEEGLVNDLYKDFRVNSTHDCFGVIIEHNEMILLVRTAAQGFIVENCGDTFAFHKDNVIYIERSDLGVPKTIISQNLKTLERQIIYEIKMNEWVDIISLDENRTYIRISEGNKSGIMDVQGNLILPPIEGKYLYGFDNETYYYVNSKNPTQLFSKGAILVHQSDAPIEAISVHDNFIVIQCRSHLEVLKEKINKFILEEAQARIEQEVLQLQHSQKYYMSVICPYKPFQIIEYDIDVKSVNIFFSQSYNGFDHHKIISEKINNIPVYYLETKFIIIRISDEDFTSLQPDDVLLLQNGAVICQVNSDANICNIVESLECLSTTVILDARGCKSCDSAAQEFFYNNSKYFGMIAYNGSFDSVYDLKKIPSLQNALFISEPNQWQTQKIVALLRENPNNEVDMNEKYSVNLLEIDNEVELDLWRTTYILSII